MRYLTDVLNGIEYEVVNGDVTGISIKEMHYDSRKIKSNDLFVCRVGLTTDGHNYVEQVIKKGAKVIVVQKDIDVQPGIVIIKVNNADEFVSKAANNYYNKPSKELFVTGITGTNGKTSISYLVQELLKANDSSVGVIGTIGMVLNSKPLQLETTMPTTPDSLELQKALSTMLEQGATDVVMEVSSIALDQSRVQDTLIRIGVFTNLTVDHLDYHETMENYERAKFELFKKCDTSVINIDDAVGRRYVAELSEKYPYKKIVTYSVEKESADYYAKEIEIRPGKTRFVLVAYGEDRGVVETNLTGQFNVSNVLASIAVACERGVKLSVVIPAFKTIQGAKGRFETLSSSRGVSVIVDYAHTPDALEKVLETIKDFKQNGYKKIITVFGCGGDRDKTKRPQMGGISEKLSDYTIVTSDNPRTEVPHEIIKEITMGISNPEKYEVEADRSIAIKKAINKAQTGDIVLIAGKGHENYQIIGDKKLYFDDLEEAKKYI